MSNNIIFGKGSAGTPVPINIDSLGHLDVVGHAHAEGGYVNFSHTFTSTDDNTDYIIIDASDTTNFPHDNTTYIHMSHFFLSVDASSNSDYTFEIGFIDNVDGTNGDFHPLYPFSGSKAVGNSLLFHLAGQPEMPKCRALSTTTSNVVLNDTAFQTDVNLPSTIDPTTADTPSGDGDLILRVGTSNGGDWTLTIGVQYHSH